jgi:S1-C subfamily serine protease
MPHITFVHGLANKPPADALISAWVDALARDDPQPQLHKKGNPGLSLDNLGATYSMVYWADVLYPSPDTAVATEEGFDDESKQIEGISLEGVGAVERAAAEDPSWRDKLGAEERAMLGRLEREVRFEVGMKEDVATAAAAAELERIPLPEFIKKPLMERLLRDLHHYFYNIKHSPRPGETYRVRDELQRRFIAAVAQVGARGRPHIVVSHSMGTVIAYDCIRNLGNCAPIDALVTVGSPLGLDEVQDQLKPNGGARVDFPPANIPGGWVNIYDRLDPVVGFDPKFANDYLRGGERAVRDEEEANWGSWRHNIVKYLSGPRLRGVLRDLLVASIEAALPSRITRPRPDAADREARLESRAAPTLPTKQELQKLSDTALSGLAKQVADAQDSGAAPERGKLADLMDGLRGRRMYPEMLLLAESAIVQNALSSSPRLARLKAQALIERSRLDDAQQVLEGIVARGADDAESLQARGLLARIAKQRYVDDFSAGERSPQKIQTAIDLYLAAYAKAKTPDDRVWPGVNAAAALCRAKRDRIRHKRASSARRIVAAVLKTIEKRYAAGNASHWDVASAGEAHLAAGDLDLAELWFRRYAELPDLEPFALASTIRQLKEVWGLVSIEGDGRRILPPLDKALARSAHTAIVSSTFVRKASKEALEKVFGDAAFMSYEKMLLGLERCKAVGRVETTANEGFGTGFVIPGNSLSPTLDDALVFVTNAHVVSDSEPDALRPAAAKVTFHALSGAKGKPFSTTFGEIIKTSRPKQLDFTVLALKDQPKKLQPFPIAPTLPSVTGKAQVFVIGHPRGGGMSFSLQDNKLIDHGAPKDARVHYRAPTEPGSSGSPVFNSSWELVALHHAGSASMKRIHGPGSYEANEGLWIQAIIADLKK